jgi:hypothetical protein
MVNWYNGINSEWPLTILVRWLLIWGKITCKLGQEGLKLAVYNKWLLVQVWLYLLIGITEH